MIKLHHLDYSRSHRVLWLLEELGLPYELVRYPRTETFQAPEALKRVHPLGKSPVLEDGELQLSESSAILRYLNQRYGQGRFAPEPGTATWAHHEEWLDFVEASAWPPVLILIFGKRGDVGVLEPRGKPELDRVIGYLSDHLRGKTYIVDDRLTLADIQLSYLGAMVAMAGVLDDYPVFKAYFEGLRQLPGCQRAEAKGGKMLPDKL
ncbi:hypothetical protein APT59_18455 [Pseudomonas oryzihabitans]|uniref:glutathione transferase n=1 Tax=Pseudomonas oryzihabitans TaxID=47885 RepID=A0A0U4WDI9_9PSED|nr:glutathione S-transferase family protein [Pseudomonas oryzihabitans]ALZ86085.1 hypothetical protein APT59_18455 [Pseudomonas oryzihabitans]